MNNIKPLTRSPVLWNSQSYQPKEGPQRVSDTGPILITHFTNYQALLPVTLGLGWTGFKKFFGQPEIKPSENTVSSWAPTSFGKTRFDDTEFSPVVTCLVVRGLKLSTTSLVTPSSNS